MKIKTINLVNWSSNKEQFETPLIWVGFFHVRDLSCQRQRFFPCTAVKAEDWSTLHVHTQISHQTKNHSSLNDKETPPNAGRFLLSSTLLEGNIMHLCAQLIHYFPLSWMRRQVFSFMLASDRNLWANQECSAMPLLAALSRFCVNRNIRSICKQPWKIWCSISNAIDRACLNSALPG